MIILNLRGKSVEIDLKPGIFIEMNGSGVGKTYLYKLLRSEKLNKQYKIYAMTYNENRVLKTGILQDLREVTYDFIFLDRYDLYVCDEINQELKKQQDTAAILLDVKNTRVLRGIGISLATVELKEDKVIVYGEDDI